MKKMLILVTSVIISMSMTAAPKNYTIASPDGKLSVEIATGDEITYSLTHSGDVIIQESPVSMTLADGTVYGGSAKVKKATRRTVDQVISAMFYKKNKVVDNYNELTLKFKAFSMVFRAYDDGMAYRFVSHSKKPFEVVAEQAQFRFAEGTTAYIPYVNARKSAPDKSQYFTSFESQYTHSRLDEWSGDRISITPLMVEGPEGKKVCITEADLVNYPGMFLKGSEGTSVLEGAFAPYPKKIEQGGHNMLQAMVHTRENYLARYEGAVSFPWRVVAVSEKDIEMADNDMVYRLAPAPDPEVDFSWVKPGKVAWDWWNNWNIYGVDFEAGINNETYKYYIDFASENGIEYVILDEGWAVNKKADLFQVVPEIDLEELVAYATERNVGLILWAGYWAFEREMERVCAHYSKMGIKGFKVDFMDADDQAMVDFHHRAAKMTADYKMMIDFHGTYKPTGLHRTYPNVVNYEGVHGLEQMKWSDVKVDQVTYDVTVPYIRMMAGPMDYTQGAMRNASRGNYRPINSEPMSQGTRCRQLAQYVIFESPLNMLCDSPSNYLAEMECTEFIAEIPTVWDETVGLDGKVGEYVAIARRSGEDWYVGAMTDWSERDMTLDLNFLPEGNYQVEIYRDGVNAHRAGCDYKKVVENCPADRKLKIHMAPGGGFAAKISLIK